MLNSLNLSTNGHYPLKLKSMFDLAIASTQRYSISPSAQCPHPLQSQHHPHLSYQLHPQYNSNEGEGEPQLHPNLESNNENNNGLPIQMEDVCLTVGGGQYRSPQSDNRFQKEAPRSPLEGRTISPNVYNNNNVTECGGKGGRQRQTGMGQSGKPSFSIEALLAHSSGWRRPAQGMESGGKNVKDNRFHPYQIAQQQPFSKRSDNSSGTVKPSSNPTLAENGEKASEQFGGNNANAGGKGASNGNGRRTAKSKRVRTIFTPEQLERLEAEFERQQYMVGPERLYLASSLYLTEAQVKVWFQNRRIKWRKQHLEMEQQRLAIYRTLAEQDMMASVGEDEEEVEEDSADCDYDTETDCPAEDDQKRGRINAFNLNMSRPSLNQLGTKRNTGTERVRLPLQQNTSNEDYEQSSTNSSSPASSQASTSPNKEESL